MPNKSRSSSNSLVHPASTPHQSSSSSQSFFPLRPASCRKMRSLGVQQRSLVTLLVAAGLCANLVASSPARQQLLQQQQLQHPQPAIRVQQCREGCYEKFATKENLCQQNAECLLCFDECAKPPPPKINKSLRESWPLHTVKMLQQDSLVLVDVAWAPLGSNPNQCLVTWEVSGGGLMGNLLTESFNVQLSLWPDTKYRVQVTCKNKLTGAMSRSQALSIDTAEAITPHDNVEQKLHRQPLPQSTPTHLPAPQLPPRNTFNDISNSIAGADNPDTDIEPNSVEQLNAPVLPYDDQSAETINQHTNFIFNWHARNSAISAIEPLQKPDMNILTIAALSDMQKPLLFGVIAGTILLTFILLLYVCMLRQHRIPNDKMALIEEDAHSVVVSLPPNANVASTSAQAAAQICKNPAICSRNTLKV